MSRGLWYNVRGAAVPGFPAAGPRAKPIPAGKGGIFLRINKAVLKEKYRTAVHSPWLTPLLLLLSSLAIGLLSLSFAMIENRWALLGSYLSNPYIAFLNLLPPVLLCFFLWFLTNSPLAAYGVTAGLVFGLTLANWYKLAFRDDPLLFVDLFLVKEAGNMLGRYSLFATPALIAALACILLGGVVMFFCARWRFPRRKKPRLIRLGAALLLALLAFPLSGLYTDGDIYQKKTDNPGLVKRWSTAGTFISKGFVYPFLRSIHTSLEHAPEGYSKKEAEAVLAQYPDGAIPEDRQVDVIGIMLEAYNDFSKYEQIPFTADPYADYHALEAEGVSGNLLTNIFAAGTVDTERAFLTGCTDNSGLRTRTNSFAWYLKSQGYQTTGSHPSHDWFYTRMNINPNLGLDNYWFFENHYGEFADRAGNIPRDDVLFPEMLRQHQEALAADDSPYFSFSVTYQGHGPYHTEENDRGEYYVEKGFYTQASENILNNYFGSVNSTGKELAAFVDSYRDWERPVVIVVFGDHNPWLGEGNSVYEEIGIDFDQSGEQGFRNYYGTRYLIWANDAAKKKLGQDFTGTGPDISPCFLMREVFDLCGWEGPAYMRYQREISQDLPVIRGTRAFLTGEGEYVNTLEGELEEKLREFKKVEYYMRHEFLYEDGKK